jgi:uncharacterized protein YllA (UPF0747 family)
MIVDKKPLSLLHKLHLDAADLFNGENIVLNKIVQRESKAVLNLDKEKKEFATIYQSIKEITKQIDPTLEPHTAALEIRHIKTLAALEKKMLRAEKRKYAEQKQQLSKLFSILFPNEGLQERTENFMLFYSRYGDALIHSLYENSLTLEQEFSIIQIEDK